jgi:hypothetical protein
VVLLVDDVSPIKVKPSTLGWFRNQNDGTLASPGAVADVGTVVDVVFFVKSSCNLSNKLAAVHASFVTSLADSSIVPLD